MNTHEYAVTSVQIDAQVCVRRAISTSDPMATIPERERWLWQNHEVMQSLARGKEDARANRVYDLGSFSQYADLDSDD